MSPSSASADDLAMPFPATAVAAQPLARQAADYIRGLIVHDLLKPGERIREQAIAEQLKISRTPLREAFRILATERLIDVLPHRGAVVVNPDAAEIRAMLQVYSSLEALGSELACAHATDADLDAVRHWYRAQQRAFAANDRIGYFQANQAFHLGIIAGSHNPILVEVHGQLNMRLYRTRYLAVMAQPDWQSAVQQHDQILAALVERDGPRLARLLTDHLGFAWRQAATAVETT